MKAGFIGTGNMGGGMAENLLAGGIELVVHDARREACEGLIELGAVWADNPRQVAEQSSVVFTSLPGPREVDEVALADTSKAAFDGDTAPAHGLVLWRVPMNYDEGQRGQRENDEQDIQPASE